MRSIKWMVGIILFASVFLEGADHIINVTVPGKKGICDGTNGTCNSWPCREVK